MKTIRLLLILTIMGNTLLAQQTTTPQVKLEDHLKGHWTQQETDNAKLVIDFVQNLMNDHNFDYVRKEFGNDKYLQHNRNLPDGLDGVVSYVEDFAKRYPEYSYDVKHIHADGDYVFFHSHVTIKAKHRGDEAKGFNISDRWRIEDGQIVEHWDSIQPINGFMRFFVWLTGGKLRNSNTIF